MSAASSLPALVQIVERRAAVSPKPASYRTAHPSLTLFLHGEGAATHDGHGIPTHRPLLWFMPRDTYAIERFQGRFHTTFAQFEWPGLTAAPGAAAALVVGCDGASWTTSRWKSPDASETAWAVTRFRRLAAVRDVARASAGLERAAILIELMCRFLELPDISEPRPGHRVIARFARLMHERWKEDIPIGEIAERLGVSTGHLRRLVHEHTGSSPLRYRLDIRLGKAHQLLLTTNDNVKQVAKAVGFSDQLYFSRLFQRAFGIAPRELIRSRRRQRDDVAG